MNLLRRIFGVEFEGADWPPPADLAARWWALKKRLYRAALRGAVRIELSREDSCAARHAWRRGNDAIGVVCSDEPRFFMDLPLVLDCEQTRMIYRDPSDVAWEQFCFEVIA